jgi:hypothetical protein
MTDIPHILFSLNNCTIDEKFEYLRKFDNKSLYKTIATNWTSVNIALSTSTNFHHSIFHSRCNRNL